MTSFYTSVHRLGNSILYRGYDNGVRVKRKIPFKPTLFVRAPAKTQSDWVALDGTPVAPVKFDSMREAKEFTEKYEDVENFSIYGNTNYIAQFIAEEFPGDIQFDRSLVRVHNIDIEVNSNLKVDENGKLTSGGSGGFPEPSVAAHIITAITIHDSVLDTFFVWGLGDYDVSKSLIRDRKISYTKCVNEHALLQCFIDFWHNEFTCPDAVTGWNIRGFDIPYLVNRIKRVCGEDTVKKLSPWGLITEKMVTMRKGQVQMYEISGIAQLDYMDLFQKFGYSFGPQENYRLDTIADVVLGERKLDYSDQYANLAELYEKNHQLYLDYNIRDTWLVDRMEDKIAMITLCLTMSYKAGVNYGDAFGTTAIWDQLIHRFLLKDKIVVPPNKNKFKSDYDGGYVKDPLRGVHDWVCSFDVNSLYPNIIVQWNMSPETIISGVIEPGVDVERMLSGFKSRRTDASMAATGQYFSNKKQGFMPKIIEAMYDERVAIKKKMLEAKRQLEKVDKSNATELYAIERLVAQYENQQTAIKILLNSLYGALGNRFFRYFTMEIAEGITLTGQYIIRWSEKHINEYINKTLKTNKDYIIAIDTDSDYVDLGDLVKTVVPDAPIDKKVDFLDKVCSKIETDVLDPAFKELKENCNAFKHRITMKREAIASRGIFVAKKRYILNVLDNEGVRYAKPKLKIMGIEAIKSSTPAPCRAAFKELFNILINGTEEQTQAYIEDFRKRFAALPPEEKAFPRGVSSIKEYMDKKTIYRKGTPINSRAAILYNHLLQENRLRHKYEPIGEGEKIKYIMLNPRNPLRENVIGFFTKLPPEFGLHQYIDNDTQFEKAFLEPAKLILDAIGWNAIDEASLEDFFS